MKSKTKAATEVRQHSHARGSSHRVSKTIPRIESIEPRVLLSGYTVNTLSDAVSPGPGLMSLRQAVAAANAHAGSDMISFSKILFAPGSLHTIKLLGGQISFTDTTGATTVTGPGAAVAAVDGNMADRIFKISAGVTVAISGLTITHGASKQTNQGGGIFSDGTLSLNSVTVANNAVVDANGAALGGGIYSTGDLSLVNSIVSGNTADGPGSPYHYVRNNEHHPAYGGGIYSAGSLAIQNSVVSRNGAQGGLYQTLTTSEFDPVAGGGIYCKGSLTISGSTVASNTASGLFLQSIEVEGSPDASGGTAFGGGIFAAGPLILTGSTVSLNAADGSGIVEYPPAVSAGDASGGGIYAAGTLSVVNSTLSGNTAAGGGDFGSNSSDGQGSLPLGGTACGGAIFSKGYLATVVASRIANNNSIGGDGGWYGDVGGNGYGGGVYVTNLLAISTTSIEGNTAAGGLSWDRPGGSGTGGGVFSQGGLTMTQCTVSGNAAKGGRGYYSDDDGGDARGGGLYAGSLFTALQSVICGNSAVGGDGNNSNAAPPLQAGAGGSGSGGGAWTGEAAVFTDCTLAGNSASGGVGGYASDSTQTPAADGGSASGGAVCADASLALLNSTISGNTVIGGKGGAGYDVRGDPYSPPPPNLPGKDGSAAGGGVSATEPLFNNAIISANKAGSAFNDVAGTILSSSGRNLIGVGGGLVNGVNGNKIGINNPMLSALGDHGGPTQTMIPLAGSPVIDAGGNARIPAGVTTDQRGLPRIFGKAVDIGATEYISLTLTGSFYNDISGDGARQAGEPGLANWQVYIDLTNAGVYVAGDPIAITNASGNYVLSSLPTTDQPLIIREIRQSNWRRTQPAGIYPLGFYTISPTAGTVANVNFGDSATALVTGTVFHDANANGKQDAGDAGISGWQILVDYLHNGVWQTNKLSTVTDSSGNYSLVLAAGTYRIHEVTQGALRATLPTGGTTTVTLAVGATQTGVNFGNR